MNIKGSLLALGSGFGNQHIIFFGRRQIQHLNRALAAMAVHFLPDTEFKQEYADHGSLLHLAQKLF